MTKDARPLGELWALELGGCPAALLDDAEYVRGALLAAVEAARATLVRVETHRYEPQGVTALALVAESHFSIHTWPEHGYAAADLFTCGRSMKPQPAMDCLIERFRPQDHRLLVLPRGGPDLVAKKLP